MDKSDDVIVGLDKKLMVITAVALIPW